MKIADVVRMFKPQSLKDVIILTRIKDDQVQIMLKSHRQVPNTHSSRVMQEQSSSASIKRINWDEMQRQITQGLCFNCNEHLAIIVLNIMVTT